MCKLLVCFSLLIGSLHSRCYVEELIILKDISSEELTKLEEKICLCDLDLDNPYLDFAYNLGRHQAFAISIDLFNQKKKK